MTRLFKIDGLKFDPDEKNPNIENAMQIPNDMTMDTVGALVKEMLYTVSIIWQFTEKHPQIGNICNEFLWK